MLRVVENVNLSTGRVLGNIEHIDENEFDLLTWITSMTYLNRPRAIGSDPGSLIVEWWKNASRILKITDAQFFMKRKT